MTAAPSRRHQWISGQLEQELRRLLQDPGLGWIDHAPIGVEFPTTEEGVQPDIIFVSRERAELLVEEGIRGAPDLVVEILSSSTAERDRTIKKKLYQRQGVAHYWIVDLEAECVTVWDFEAAGEPTHYVHRLPVEISGRRRGEIDLPEVFAPERGA